MMPIPPEIAARWSPMWAAGHPTRPWWQYAQIRSLDVGSLDGRTHPDEQKLIRIDGAVFQYRGYSSLPWRLRQGAPAWVPGWYQAVFPDRGLVVAATSDSDPMGPILDVLAKWDAEHPLPTPPLMPGQVWVVDGEELTVLSPESEQGRVTVAGRMHELTFQLNAQMFTTRGLLVSGPTPWGRDVPWAPVTVTQVPVGVMP